MIGKIKKNSKRKLKEKSEEFFQKVKQIQRQR
jgi:hypothetical protein